MSDIKEKIRAILAKAASTEFEAEAETFLAKANELMEKYQIDLGDLVDSEDPVVWNAGIKGTPSDPSWHRHLYIALGRYYGCRSVRETRRELHNGKFRTVIYTTLTGRESAIVTTNEMFPWIIKQCNAQGREIAKLTGNSAQNEARRVGNALVFRLSRMTTSPDKPKTEAAQRFAMMTLDRVEVVIRDHYPTLRSTRGRGIGTHDLARDAAGKINLNRQTGAGEGPRRLGKGK
jgi:hypothetical protein